MDLILDFFENLLGLPVLASEHGKSVDGLIIYVHLLMIVLFIGWLAYFCYVLWRFHRSRNPKADYTGVKNHASNWIEGAVAIVEGVLLLGLAVPLWAKAVDKFPDKSKATVIHVVGQQFNWNALYAGKDGEFGKQDMQFVSPTNVFGLNLADPQTKDDAQLLVLGEMHVPVNKPVICYVSSRDVIHSFKLIAMRVTQDAIPGMRTPCWFTPTQKGRYQINCAQLCGNGHSSMASGTLVVEDQADFDKWLEAAPKAGTGAASFE
jgi:cytochrome c oxidase subunit 2